MKTITVLLLLLLLVVSVGFFCRCKQEGFQLLPAKFHATEFPMENMVLAEQYESTGKYGVTNDSAASDWWHMPIFPARWVAAMTNNLKYWKNPDNGSCTRSEMCGMYRDKKVPSNLTAPLPPVPPGAGVRIGYYREK
jgi:hypothetical protein